VTRLDIKWEPGSNIRTVISRILNKTPYIPFIELGCNSYDADADRVSFVYESGSDTLIVADDGNGMNEDGIESFVRLSDSIKPKKPVSPKGRKIIGQFGVATVLIEELGRSYTLETWKDGIKRTFSESLPNTDSKITVLTEDAPGHNNGTHITISDLLFPERPGFSINELKKALAFELPSQEFDVYLNGGQLIQAKFGSAKTFYYEDVLPNAGPVDIKIDFFRTPPPFPGVYVRVNKRPVGKPDYFDLHGISRTLVNRICAEVNADGLNRYIVLDRTIFRRDIKAFREVEDWIYQKLKQARKSLEPFLKEDSGRKVRSFVSTGLRDLRRGTPTKRGRSSGDRQVNSGHEKDGQEPDYVRLPDYDTFYGQDNDPISRRGEQGQLSLNLNHPFLDSSRPYNIPLHLYVAGAYGLAQDKLRLDNQFPVADAILQIWNDKFDRYCRVVFDRKSIADIIKAGEDSVHGSFVDDGIYSETDISGAGISPPTLRRFIASGLLEDKGGREIGYIGRDINPCIDMLSEGVPAYQLVKKLAAEEKGLSRQRITQLGDRIDEFLTTLYPFFHYVKKAGKKEPFFFLIDNGHIPEFTSLYKKSRDKEEFKDFNIFIICKDFQKAEQNLWENYPELLINLRENPAEFDASENYAEDEIISHGILAITFRKLVDSGFLEKKGSEVEYSGEDLNKYLEAAKGFVPAHEIVRHECGKRRVESSQKRIYAAKIDEILLLYDEYLPDIKNIGTQKNPLFLVKQEYINEFNGLYWRGRADDNQLIINFYADVLQHIKKHSPEIIDGLKTEKFNDDMFYNRAHVGLRGFSLYSLDALVHAGLIKRKLEHIELYGKDKGYFKTELMYSGKDINEYLKIKKGFVPAQELVWNECVARNINHSYKVRYQKDIDWMLTQFDKYMPGIQNIGTQESPFFLIKEDYAEEFLGLYWQGREKRDNRPQIIKRAQNIVTHIGKRCPQLFNNTTEIFEPDEFYPTNEVRLAGLTLPEIRELVSGGALGHEEKHGKTLYYGRDLNTYLKEKKDAVSLDCP